LVDVGTYTHSHTYVANNLRRLTHTLQRKHLFEYQNTFTTMADATKIAENGTIPALSPLHGVAPATRAVDSQKWLLGSTGIAVP
jgi:hypothetical protein